MKTANSKKRPETSEQRPKTVNRRNGVSEYRGRTTVSNRSKQQTARKDVRHQTRDQRPRT